ncbi:hypothetical protein [Deinococcus depolymerans]|uniref:Uncharacterized protein n=1 Tax=Deinococcus depolymerans TaxID=392408 RepID=A0ABN1BPC8_9DEIO
MTWRACPLAHLLLTLLLLAAPPVTWAAAAPATPLPAALACVTVPASEQLPVELTDGRTVLGETLAAQLGEQLLILAADAPLIGLDSSCGPLLFTPLTLPAELHLDTLTLTVQPGAAFYGERSAGSATPATPSSGAVLHASVAAQTTAPGSLGVSGALHLEAQLPGGAGLVAAVSGAAVSGAAPAAVPTAAAPPVSGQVGAAYAYLRRPDAQGGTWEARAGLLPGPAGSAPGFSVQRRAPRPPTPDVWIETATPATYSVQLGAAVLSAGTVPAGRTQLRDLPFPATAGTATLTVTDATGTREQRLPFDARADRRAPGEVEGRIEYRRTARDEWAAQLRWTAREVEYTLDGDLGPQDRLGLSAQGNLNAAGVPVTLSARLTARREADSPHLTAETGLQADRRGVQFGARTLTDWTPAGLDRWQVQTSVGWQGPWGAAQAQLSGGQGRTGPEVSASARTALPRGWLPAGWSARLGATATRAGGQLTGQLLLTLSRAQPDLTVESGARTDSDGTRTQLSAQGPLYLPGWNASYRADIRPDPALTVSASGPVSLRLNGTLGPPGTLAVTLGGSLALTPTPDLLPTGFSGVLKVQLGQPGVPVRANGARAISDSRGVAHLPFLLGQEFLVVSIDTEGLPLGVTALREDVRVALGSATVQLVDLGGELRREPLRRVPVPPGAQVWLRGQPVTLLDGSYVLLPSARDGDPLVVLLPGGAQLTCVWGPAEVLPCR